MVAGGDPNHDTRVVILGGGPAGLAAARTLVAAGRKAVVLEASPHAVGGISRTEIYRGYRFDIGGHRFFTKSKEVEAFWNAVLPNDFLLRRRKSRIYYQRKFYSYPLEPFEALRNLGLVESARCGLSFVRARYRPYRDPKTFEEWVVNHFGRRLYQHFFRAYTEKVWGIPCDELSSDWAAQRIKGLSLRTAVAEALRRRVTGGQGRTIRTLIEEFRYPKFGPGQLWDACAEQIREMGGEVRMGYRVERLQRDAQRGTWRVYGSKGSGEGFEFQAKEVISSLPLGLLLRSLVPVPPAEVLQAAQSLRYRDFLTVALIVRDEGRFDDNWIYVQEPGVHVGRIQNYKVWSPWMVPDEVTVCYGLEYFCWRDDRLWQMTDDALLRLATEEMASIGLVNREKVEDGTVVRQPKAYPVYDQGYRRHLERIVDYVRGLSGLQVSGRNGLHRYNNQDHSMLTGMACAKNILEGTRRHDPWKVNEDSEYHETVKAREDDAR